ncbi:ftsY [Symbiodinium necroappetens]|uniref:FtsY protein n=1 Tax=Symbiodinium necroappetens TaxID=1628268 RepID=A0A812XZ96_9DINO|nr:ftsY [Symbiodinium necroappetens]
MAFLKNVVSKVRKGLSRTRESFVGSLRSVLLGRKVDEALLAELEKTLIQSDVGVKPTMRLLEGIRAAWKAGEIKTGEEVLAYLKREIAAMWPDEDRRLNTAASGPTVILVAGINGAGKTTSIAKLTRLLRDGGSTVLLAACDTFRAGAVRQLEIWSERLGVEVIKGQQGGDPAAVAFDACDAAIARNVDYLVIDTAGRLHTQDPLMRQLTKIRDIVRRKFEGGPHEVILVLDATTGQNAVRQAEEFTQAIDVSGIFLAKLDGTAKGGVVIAINEAVGVPVKFIGLGETPEDVEPFNPELFVEALFSEPARAEA